MGGNKMSNPHQVTRDFEQALCDYTGAPYCVTVESCSAALFLSFLYCNVKNANPVKVPKITYPSVPASIVNASGRVDFVDMDWQKNGYYNMDVEGTDFCYTVNDSAKYFARGMFKKLDMASFVCLSFHVRKALPIGRGGAILTDEKEAYDWLKCARFDGRHEAPLPTDTLVMPGWNAYLNPEQAARGLELLSHAKDEYVLSPDPYQDLSKYKFFTEANR
jgi:dTDP-4-amino-4,6-dideoxygalactose transaminase